MFLIAISVIIAITLLFLFFSSDMDLLNRKFLSEFGIKTEHKSVSSEEIEIPYVFDDVYNNYNLIQIQAGFDLMDYRGKKAIRYTYKIQNFPNDTNGNIYANVICLRNRQIGGDICCVGIDGFILPLNYLSAGN